MTLYIGIDLSTDPVNTGIAFLTSHKKELQMPANNGVFWCGNVNQWSRQLRVRNLITEPTNFTEKAQQINYIITQICQNFQRDRIFVAIDVPFGWPSSFTRSLRRHQIGNHLQVDDNEFFYRATELLMRRNGLDPLSVSTDKLGRTALLGSKILNLLIEQEFAIQLSRGIPQRRKIIEVYPTATAFALSDNPDANFSIRHFYSGVLDVIIGNRAKIDKYDAVTAAYTAYLLDRDRGFFYRRGKTNLEKISMEGWIWAPKRTQLQPQEQRERLRNQLEDLLRMARGNQFPRP